MQYSPLKKTESESIELTPPSYRSSGIGGRHEFPKKAKHLAIPECISTHRLGDDRVGSYHHALGGIDFSGQNRRNGKGMTAYFYDLDKEWVAFGT